MFDRAAQNGRKASNEYDAYQRKKKAAAKKYLKK